MNAKFRELLADLRTSTGGGKVIVDQAKFRAFLHKVNELITEVEVDAGRAGYLQALADVEHRIDGYYGATDEQDQKAADEYADKIRRGKA